jgi:hypothetical protein
MSHGARRLWRGALVTLGVIVALWSLGTSETPAGPKAVPPCITPTAVSVNERWGIADAVVAPFCTQVNSGRRWVPSNAWFMNTAFDAVPPSFVAQGATPVQDFVAKFVGVKYVVDAGTNKEKTYVFPNDESLGILLNVEGFDVVNSITLGSLKPLSVGDHTIDSYFIFSAMHCDGLPPGDPDQNCLPAGETLFSSVEFTVTPEHN